MCVWGGGGGRQMGGEGGLQVWGGGGRGGRAGREGWQGGAGWQGGVWGRRLRPKALGCTPRHAASKDKLFSTYQVPYC